MPVRPESAAPAVGVGRRGHSRRRSRTPPHRPAEAAHSRALPRRYRAPMGSPLPLSVSALAAVAVISSAWRHEAVLERPGHGASPAVQTELREDALDVLR